MCECNHEELAHLPIEYLVDALALSGWQYEDLLKTHDGENGVYTTMRMSQDEMITHLLYLKSSGLFAPIEHKEKKERACTCDDILSIVEILG